MTGVAVLTQEIVDDDDRRTLTELRVPNELNGSSSVGRLKICRTKGDATPAVMGQHYHRYTHEIFQVVSGQGILLAQEMTPLSRPAPGCGFKMRPIIAGDVVIVPQYNVHTFVSDLELVMVCIASTAKYEPHDKPGFVLTIPDLVTRAQLNLQAMSGLKDGLPVAEDVHDHEICYTFPNDTEVVLITDIPRISVHGHSLAIEQDCDLGPALREVAQLVAA